MYVQYGVMTAVMLSIKLVWIPLKQMTHLHLWKYFAKSPVSTPRVDYSEPCVDDW